MNQINVIRNYIQIDSVTFNQEIIWICLSKILLRRYAIPNLNIHRENSPVTQTTLELTLLTLKGPIPYIYGTQVWLSLCLQMS